VAGSSNKDRWRRPRAEQCRQAQAPWHAAYGRGLAPLAQFACIVQPVAAGVDDTRRILRADPQWNKSGSTHVHSDAPAMARCRERTLRLEPAYDARLSFLHCEAFD